MLQVQLCNRRADETKFVKRRKRRAVLSRKSKFVLSRHCWRYWHWIALSPNAKLWIIIIAFISLLLNFRSIEGWFYCNDLATLIAPRMALFHIICYSHFYWILFICLLQRLITSIYGQTKWRNVVEQISIQLSLYLSHSLLTYFRYLLFFYFFFST